MRRLTAQSAGFVLEMLEKQLPIVSLLVMYSLGNLDFDSLIYNLTRLLSKVCSSLLLIYLGAIHKGRPADPGGGGLHGIRTFNCYSSVILLVYPDAGGGGSKNPGFSRTSFVNGPLEAY